MKKLLFLFFIALASCQPAETDITGHWTVLKQYSDGAEITPSNPGITFGEDGLLELEWAQKPNMTLPQTHYRISNDTIYWTTENENNDRAATQDGKLIIEWEGEHLILKADKNNYTVLERATK
jgi:hypothetical protein